MNAVSRLDFSSPSAGYDQPLEMWIDCHKRIARMNSLLQRLVDHLKHHAVDKHAGVTATSIRRYFDEAAPRHHDDEEVDLFPRGPSCKRSRRAKTRTSTTPRSCCS